MLTSKINHPFWEFTFHRGLLPRCSLLAGTHSAQSIWNAFSSHARQASKISNQKNGHAIAIRTEWDGTFRTGVVNGLNQHSHFMTKILLFESNLQMRSLFVKLKKPMAVAIWMKRERTLWIMEVTFWKVTWYQQKNFWVQLFHGVP